MYLFTGIGTTRGEKKLLVFPTSLAWFPTGYDAWNNATWNFGVSSMECRRIFRDYSSSALNRITIALHPVFGWHCHPRNYYRFQTCTLHIDYSNDNDTINREAKGWSPVFEKKVKFERVRSEIGLVYFQQIFRLKFFSFLLFFLSRNEALCENILFYFSFINL